MGVELNTEKLKEGLTKYFVDDDMSMAYRELQEEGKSLKRVFALIWEGVEAVEKLAQDMALVSAGAEKKKALVSWLDDVVKFTGFAKIFEAVDGKVIGAIVDGIIIILNRRLGNKWLETWSKYI